MNLISRQNGNSVIFYRYDELVLKVDEKKLLDKSAYFRAMFKKCYRDHKSDLIDVCISENEETFYKVMQFITSDNITLDINSIFETYHLAVFLQIGCLQQFCLDHFTLNLNRKTLHSNLDLISNYGCLFGELEKRALMFNKTGNISFSGLYFLQQNSEGT